MPIRLDSAAHRLCDLGGWTLSNLELQKLLYLAQVQHALENDGAPLLAEGFQAWDYGPVIPSLYRRLKMFGASTVRNVFPFALNVRSASPSGRSLEKAWDDFGGVAPGELIEVSHWDRGAWAAKYEPGIRGTRITQQDIALEAANRRRFADEWERLIAT